MGIPLIFRNAKHIAKLAGDTSNWPRECFKPTHKATITACLDAAGIGGFDNLPPAWRKRMDERGITEAQRAAVCVAFAALTREVDFRKLKLAHVRPWPVAVVMIRAELCGLAYLRQSSKPPSVLGVETFLRILPRKLCERVGVLKILRAAKLKQVVLLAAKEAHKAHA